MAIAGYNRKLRIALPALVIVFALLAGLYWIRGADGSSRGDVPIAEMNGEPLSMSEFQMVLQLQKSKVFEEFRSRYGAQFDDRFWNTQFEGRTPLERAKQAALDELTRIKLQQMLARDEGLTDDIGYEAFLERLRSENARRSEAVADGRVISGPMRYDAAAYYDDQLAKLVIELKEKLASEGKWAQDEQTLRAYYEKIKETAYRAETKRTLQKITIPYADAQEKAATARKAENLLRRIKGGADFAAEPGYSVTQFSGRAAAVYSDEDLRLAETVSQLDAGQVYPEAIDTGTGYVIVKVAELARGGIQPYEQVRDNVRQKWIDFKYDEQIEQLAKEAKVEIREEAWNRVKMD